MSERNELLRKSREHFGAYRKLHGYHVEELGVTIHYRAKATVAQKRSIMSTLLDDPGAYNTILVKTLALDSKGGLLFQEGDEDMDEMVEHQMAPWLVDDIATAMVNTGVMRTPDKFDDADEEAEPDLGKQ